MKRMCLFLLGGILLGTLPLFAMDWPAPEGEPVNNFGWNDQGMPLLGSSFRAEGPIQAAGTGEIIFVRNSKTHASRLPSPLGAWLAIDHGDGLVSIYSRFEDQTPSLPDSITEGTVIAAAGRSGWTNRTGFYFSFFDRRERRWVNPSMIISPLPDTRPPLIQSVELRNAEGRLINPAQVRSISQGHYTILVNATDTRLGPGESPLAPFKIVCSVNGVEIGALNFETYSTRDGVLMASRNSLVPVRQVYDAAPSYEAGEVWFTRGQATLELIAQDITGNSRNATFRLQVD
jgi:hypothetical protein